MSKDLIINCPNNCENNCKACYLKQLGIGKYTKSMDLLYDQFLGLLEDKESINSFDNFHLFSANIPGWNFMMTKLAHRLLKNNRINNKIYIYIKYDDNQSFKEIIRELYLSSTSIQIKGNDFVLVFSIIDPDKSIRIYNQEISKKIFAFTSKFGKPAHIMFSYTFTNDYILNLQGNNGIIKVIKNIKMMLNLSEIIIDTATQIAFSIAKPYPSDKIEMMHNINFYNDLVKETSKLIIEDKYKAIVLSDNCLTNYIYNMKTSLELIQVYKDCMILTPQESDIVSNSCPYTVDRILDCNQCPLFNEVQSGTPVV